MTGTRIEGKVVIVTGAGRGIGRAVAVRCAGEGASVLCVDVLDDSAVETASLIVRSGGDAAGMACDVSTPEGNGSMVERSVAEFGGVDVLVANAAVQFLGSLEETSVDDWERMESTNLRGAYLGVQAVLPVMRRRGGGSIILTGSVLGIVGDPDLPAYGAMKGGVRAMCRAVATAHGPENIRCNTVCPGDVATRMNDEFFDHQPDPDAARREIADRYPLRRLATTRDVANAVLFLASEDASYLNGIDIIVDGGLLARIY